MMKKVWLVLLAVVLVFGLVVSCGGSSDDDDKKKDKEGGPPFAKEDADQTLKIEKNEYSNDKANSKGNQGKFTFTKLALAKPAVNDTYTLTFECYSDIDVAEGMSLTIVDSSEAAGWWLELGEWDAEAAGEGAENLKYANIAEVKKETLIKFTGTFTVKTAPKGGADDICLVFAMEAQPWAEEATLYFKPFTITKN